MGKKIYNFRTGYLLYPAFIYIIFLVSACHPDQAGEELILPSNTAESISINTIDTLAIDTVSINRSIHEADAIRISGKNMVRSKLLFWIAARKSKTINYPLGITRSLVKLMAIYTYTKQYDSAMACYKVGIRYAQKLPREYCYTELMHIVMSWSYYGQGNTDSALAFCYRAMKEIDRHPISASGYKNAFQVYRTLGAIWYNLGHDDIALPYLTKAGELSQKVGDSAIINTYTNIKAAIYFRNSQYDSTVLLFKQVLASKYASDDEKLDANHNLGIIYTSKEALNQPSKAISYCTEALQLCRQLYGVNSVNEIIYLSGLGDAYAQKGSQEKNEHDAKKAEAFYTEAYKRKGKYALEGNLPLLYSNFATVYAIRGKFRKAYEMQAEAIHIRDSLYKKEQLEMKGKLDVQYRVAGKDKQLATQQLQLANQKTWIIATGAGALLLLGLSIGLLKRKKHKEEMARLQAVLTGREEERVRMARELHDGVLSHLSAVKLNFSAMAGWKEEREEPAGFQEAIQQLEQSIQELRTTSHNLYPGILQQEGLVQATRIFCEKISNLAPVTVVFQLIGILPPLSPEFQLEVYRMIQELVQNIVKHAQASQALVQFTASNEGLQITIDDNGKGIPPEELNSGKGIGLNQLRKRIEVLNGSIDMESDSGTSVYIEFDLRQK